MKKILIAVFILALMIGCTSVPPMSTPNMNFTDSSTTIKTNLIISTEQGLGNAYACFNPDGTIYRSGVACI